MIRYRAVEGDQSGGEQAEPGHNPADGRSGAEPYPNGPSTITSEQGPR